MERLHPIAAIVRNESGVLARIAGLFARRGFNIDSLTVGETEDPEHARITLIVRGDDRTLEQVVKQLSRLIDVIKVSDMAENARVQRELALVRVHAPPSRRSEVIELVDVFRAKIVDVGRRSVMIESSGSRSKVDALIDMLRPYGIVEIARTGRILLARGGRGEGRQAPESDRRSSSADDADGNEGNLGNPERSTDNTARMEARAK